MTLAATDSALVWTGFVGQKHAPDTSAWRLSRDNPVLRQTAEQLQQYFAAERTAFHSAQGPQLGLPQMIQSRAQFGYIGVAVLVLFALFFRARRR